MYAFNKIHRPYRFLFWVLGFIFSIPALAERGGGGWHSGGGFHQGNVGNYSHHNQGYQQGINNQYDRYHNNYDNNYNSGYSVGNYYPGGGWVAPGVVVAPTANTTVNDTDCQTIQQCNDDGTCILSQSCY